MSIVKLKPSYKDYLWGGTMLKENYNKDYEGDVLAETWELSCHADGDSFVSGGEFDGATLCEFIINNGKEVLGRNCENFEDFPILVKFIDAKDNLSIQVHPNDEYALKIGEKHGKNEVWYVLDSKPNTFLYCGFNKTISKEEYAKRIASDTLLEVLNKVEVKKGDVFFIEAGTIHAIGKDITVAEIQQNSNVTYRVYDYGRTDKDGKKRELHIDKAIEVTNLKKFEISKNNSEHLAKCKYFTVDKLELHQETKSVDVNENSFKHFLIVDGSCELKLGDEIIEAKKGDSYFVTANSGNIALTGSAEILITYL